MVKGMSKRGYHKKDVEKVNRMALTIGSIGAVITFSVVLISFLMQ